MSMTKNKWADGCLYLAMIAIFCTFGYLQNQISKVELLTTHISEVVQLSDNFKRDYGCLPTAPNAFTDLNVFKNPEFNSCNRKMDIDNAFSPVFSGREKIQIANNQLVFTDEVYEATGDIKVIDDKIIYHLKVSDNEINELLYHNCAMQHAQSHHELDVKNYKTISDKTPCGKDIDGNLLLQIGTMSKNETPHDPDVKPRQTMNEANLSMLQK